MTPAERLRTAFYLLHVMVELDREPDCTMKVAVVTLKPDGTGRVDSVVDADSFLADLGALTAADPRFDPKAVVETLRKNFHIESAKTLGILPMMALDEIQKSLGLPRDPETAKDLDSLAAGRKARAENS